MNIWYKDPKVLLSLDFNPINKTDPNEIINIIIKILVVGLAVLWILSKSIFNRALLLAVIIVVISIIYVEYGKESLTNPNTAKYNIENRTVPAVSDPETQSNTLIEEVYDNNISDQAPVSVMDNIINELKSTHPTQRQCGVHQDKYFYDQLARQKEQHSRVMSNRSTIGQHNKYIYGLRKMFG